MNVLVAGSGRVALALEAAFRAAGLSVSRWSRRDGAGDDGSRPPEVAVLAVSDRAIGEVAERLLADGVISRATVLLHTAGAVPPESAFATVRSLVSGTGLLHPLRALAGAPSDALLAGTVFGVAGDEAGRQAAARLATAIGGRVLVIRDDGLARYHAAAVLASNHTLALLDAAVSLLVDQGLPRRAAEEAVGGLVGSAAANVTALGLPAALTGPIARGDVATVEHHLSSLPAALLPLYRATGLATVALARHRGGPSLALDRIAALLSGS